VVIQWESRGKLWVTHGTSIGCFSSLPPVSAFTGHLGRSCPRTPSHSTVCVCVEISTQPELPWIFRGISCFAPLCVCVKKFSTFFYLLYLFFFIFIFLSKKIHFFNFYTHNATKQHLFFNVSREFGCVSLCTAAAHAAQGKITIRRAVDKW
jgi:hypothetical protein